MDRTLIRAIAFIDSQDTSNKGWAYRLTFSDNHQESDALDSALDDGAGAASELAALIAANDGPEVAIGSGIEYHDAEEGSFRWSAE